jgi:acyl transferase domain-containing protein/acyl carrier protein
VYVLTARTPDRLREQAQRLLAWVEAEHVTDADLPDIAYTLQVGREHHDERLAFRAATVAELTARLRDHVDGAETGDLHRGRVKRGKDTIALLADDEDMTDTVAAWVRKGKFGKLLDLWVTGLGLSWRTFYSAPAPRRVSLPAYPFERERFWYPGSELADTMADKSAVAGAAVPTTVATASVADEMTGKPTGIVLSPPAGVGSAAPAGPVPVSTVALTAVSPIAPVIQAAEPSPAPAAEPSPAPVAVVLPDLDALVTELSAGLAQALYLAHDEVDPDVGFTDLGLDSIIGVEWVKVINKRYGLCLPATKLYDACTVRLLAEHVRVQIGTAGGAVAPESVAAEPATVVPPEQPVAHGGPVPSLDELMDELATGLAQALYLAEDEVDPDVGFTDLGLDSIIGVEWVKVINKSFGLSMPATKFYDHPTVRELADALRGELVKGGRGLPAPSVEPAPEHAAAPRPAQAPEPVPASVPQTRTALTLVPPVAPSPLLPARTAPMVPPAAVATRRDAIAVVGMAGRYPGADDLGQYWTNLAAGRDSVREIPKSRWDVDKYYDPRPNQPGKIYCRSMGVLDDVDVFDPMFFAIPPAEAESMDPQQRLFLQEAYHAFEDAGYDVHSLSGSKCGVYLGIMSNEYGMLMQQRGGGSATSNSNAISAARIAYFLNLKGPAIALDTACSSSLVASHLAAQALKAGEIDMALVGGVTLYLSPESYISMCGAGMLATDGKCKTFDNSADGFVPGEGVGALVLKRLEDAERDGDHVYGVLLGSGINQDGKTNGITAPSAASQAELERDVYARNGIDPAGIGYVETHGTGTKLGDPIEMEALTTVFRERTDEVGYCAIGSVKSNLGHTSAAAGIASIQKVLLCMANGSLVPTLHFAVQNEHFDLATSPFYVNTEFKPWPVRDGDVRRAAVSSFGFSGTNAHLVLAEHYRAVAEPAADPGAPGLFLLSAKSTEQLRTSAARLAAHVTANPDLDLRDLAHTLRVGREAMPRRLALVASGPVELAAKLTRCAEGGTGEGVFTGYVRKKGVSPAAGEDPVALVGAGMDLSACEKLAELWVDGTVLDWSRLRADGARRVPLPTYPFARQHYWLSDAPDLETVQEPAALETPASQAFSVHADSLVLSEGAVLLKPVWDISPRPTEPASPAPGRVVVIGGSDEHWARVRAVLPFAERVAVAGETVEAIAARLTDGEPIGHLVWLPPGGVLAGMADDTVVDAQEVGIYACFRTLKALLASGHGRRDLDITVVTEHSQPVLRGESVDPTHVGLHGLFGSVAKEFPRWRVRVADLDRGRDWPLAEVFELSVSDRGTVWAYRRGRWYRQALVPVQAPAAGAGPTSSYRDGGTYVVIGGAGGIGEAWTEHLVRAHRAKVVWIGRRAEDDEIRAKLSRIAAFGPAPTYLQADATRRDSLEAAYRTIKRDHAAVNGIVQSAIVLLDQSLERMDEERFRGAVRAKIDVSVRMAQVFGGEPLDFVLFFSSMNSFLKAPGQSNYVAGSVFEDAFAHQLAKEIPADVKVMNWGYWGSVGIVASQRYQDRMAEAGAASIEPADGMAALDVLLTGAFDQLGLVKAQLGEA